MAATRRWMAFTTALTRHEGRVLAEELELADARHALDIGGNSGELAVQLHAAHPHLRLSVFDLPVVCRIGREHVAARAPGAPVDFVAGDVRRDRLPGAMDLVTLKSILHDWPELDAIGILERAAAALRPGGRLVIFERGPLRPTGGLPFAQLSNLVFFHFFRDPRPYLEALARLGFDDVRCDTIALETDFNLITATRPRPRA